MVEMILFVIIGLLAVVAAVGVVAQRNVLYSGLLLVCNLVCLAALYILMNAQFVAAVQIIVYAGAVMVLFLFAVMMLGGKRSESRSQRLAGQRLLGPLLALVLGVELVVALVWGLGGGARAAAAPSTLGSVGALAEVLFTRYLWAFEATGLLVLVAVVGVVYLLRGGSGSGARG